MRVKESIKELRQICQYSRDNAYTKRPWPERKLARPLSIYLTKLFLVIGISASQASFIGLITTIIGGAFLIFPGAAYWFIGIGMLLLGEVIGNVDGEIARYNKSASSKGAFWNAIPEQFVSIYTPICMSFGIHNMFHNIYPFIFGFVAVASIALTTSAILLPYLILRDKELLAETLVSDRAAKPEGRPSLIIRLGHFINHFTIVLIVFLVATVIDSFMSPLNVGPLSVNTRYAYFVIFTAQWLVMAVRNLYLPLHGEVKLRL